MPAVLIVTQDKIQVDKVVVTTTPFIIGRSSQCSLTLKDNMLSRQHCEITEAGGGYQVADKGSRNGIEVNGSPVTAPAALQEGDKIGVGPFELIFYASEGDVAGLDEDDEDKTRFAGMDDAASAAKQLKQDDADEGEQVSADASYQLTVLNGPLKGSEWENWRADLVLGRSTENDVILPDDAASGRHARLHKDHQTGRMHLEDFGSSNGTFLNNRRVTGSKPLSSRDKIRIGTTMFQYVEVDPVKQKAMRKKLMLATVAVVLIVVVGLVLKPEDKAAKYMERGNELLNSAKYADAIAMYNKVLEVAPNHRDAKAGISTAKSNAEAAEFLEQAKQAALEERYDDAFDIVHRVLRLHKDHREAKEFLEVVNLIKESKVAADANNWPDAIRLIKKALEAYPDSEVLLTGLERAEAEQTAVASLEQADTMIAEKSFAKARAVLSETSEQSHYYAATQEKLAMLDKLEKAEHALQSALEAYRQGDREGAVKWIQEGLDSQADYQDLLTLRKDIDTVTPMLATLDESETILESGDVAAIRDMARQCERVMNVRVESEEIAKVRVRAGELVNKLRERLQGISQDELAQGNTARDGQDLAVALGHYLRASEADPGNEEAATWVTMLKKKLGPIAKEHYQQALVQMELEQIDLAIKEYEKVLNVTVDADDYHQRAKKRLKRLRGEAELGF